MDVRTGSKSWGYSKRPRNWKKIMYKEIDPSHESGAPIDEIPEIDKSLKSDAPVEEIIPEIDKCLKSEAPVDEIIPEIDEIIPEVDEIIHPPEVEEKPPKIDEKPKIGQGLKSEASIEKPKITARVSNPDSSFSHM